MTFFFWGVRRANLEEFSVMGDFILVLKTSERPTPVATSAAVLEMTAPPPTTTLPTDSHAELEALRIAFAHAGAPDDLAAAPSVLSSLAPEPLALIVEAMAWLVESHRTVDEQLQRANFATKRAQRESVRLQTERDEWKERFIAQDRKQAAVESKLKKATQEFKAERTALRAKVERLTKGGRKLEHLVNQYRATIRRKEGDYARLQDRLSKLFKQKHVAAARGLQVNAERSAATTVADATGAAGEPLTKATAVSKTTRRRRPSTSSSKAGGASGLASSRRPSLRKGGAKAMRAAAAEKVAAKAAPALESTPAAAATAEAALHAEARLATEAHRVAAAAETATLRAALQALGAPADAELQGWAATRASRWAAHCLEEEGQTAQAQNSLPPKPPTAGPLSSNEAEAQALVVQQLERRLAAATRTQDTAAMEVQRVRAQMAKLKRARAATAKRTHSAASDASDAKLRRDNDELRELVAQHKSLLHASLAGGLPGAASSAVAPLVATASSAQALPPSTPRCVEALRFGGDSPSASARDEVAIERVQVSVLFLFFHAII